MAGVLIVGGGLIGSSIAWRLAQKGAQVTLADAGNLGGEASPAGAGMLAPGSETVAQAILSPASSFASGRRQDHLRYFESLRMYPDFVAELREETGVAIDFRICGGIVIGSNGERQLFPDEGIVDPAELLRALRCACEKRKVRVARKRISAVESIEHDAVVIAAGAWSGQIKVTHRARPIKLPPTIPIKGHLIGFALAPGLLGPFLRQDHTYVLQRSNGFVIAGSNEEQVGFDTHVDIEVCNDIHQRATRLFPALEGTTPVKSWIGFRPRSIEGDAPHVGRVEGTNIWLAYGHYRNGILLTPLTAQRVAEEIISVRGA